MRQKGLFTLSLLENGIILGTFILLLFVAIYGISLSLLKAANIPCQITKNGLF